MSGGSMDYLFSTIECRMNFHQDTPERKAFAKHMELVCAALHDIEWVDSCDYAPGNENAAILKCINHDSVLLAAIETAKDTLEKLEAAIVKAEAMR